ncbi:WecB/TagA/CpsF family glycosyltransferase [Mycolicibacterium tusciae]|uniref:WecB/TagA/CpsF family glycosyltransferase n=1 Tax=Mycolicibacterium tusciae TaxID=75922 RepID=UPI00058BD6B3|nr:WecB/TagA/CpsF family glycosyltransferase [Mycolicibacterium tusciae]
MNTPLDCCRVGALDFQVTTLARAVNRTIEDALSKRSDHVHLANAWSIALADDDDELREVFRNGRNYPDGKPVVWAMNWLSGGDGTTQPSRVYGPTFFERTLDKGVARRVKHYFLGGTPETLEKLQSNVRTRFPGVDIVGVSSPPFKDLTSDDFDYELSKIELGRPHIIWVGLGTPKQDKAAAYLASRYPGIFACVGAAFDFTAGNLRDVPLWIQNAGLAWLFRLAQEPRRLWRRYLFGNAKFIRIVLSQLVKERLGKTAPRDT